MVCYICQWLYSASLTKRYMICPLKPPNFPIFLSNIDLCMQWCLIVAHYFRFVLTFPLCTFFWTIWGIDHLDHNLFFVQFRSQQFYLFSKHKIKVNTRLSVENLAPWWTLFWYLFIFLDHRGAIQIVGCTYSSSSNFILSCRTHKTTTKGYLCFRSIWRCSVWTEQPRNRSQISGSCYCSCLWCSCCSSWGGSFAY